MRNNFRKTAVNWSLTMLLAGGQILYAQTVPAKFIDPANMDKSVHPGDDFYTYASGAWVKNNPVPAKETRWGSFNIFLLKLQQSCCKKAFFDKNCNKMQAWPRGLNILKIMWRWILY